MLYFQGNALKEKKLSVNQFSLCLSRSLVIRFVMKTLFYKNLENHGHYKK